MTPVMDTGWVLRGLRAAVFAAVCVLLAALGHAVMSDATIPAWMLLTAWAGTSAGAWCCAGRERGPLLVGLLTVGAQTALHSAFSFGQAMAAGAGGTGASSSSGEGFPAARQWANAWMCGAQGMRFSDGEAARMLELIQRQQQHLGHADPMPGMHDGPAGMHGSPTGMLAAHLLVALLSAWWLWGGERAAFRLVRTVSAWLFAPLVLVLRVVLPEVRRVVRSARQEPRRAVRKLLLAHVMTLRGPPYEPAVS
ncbi:PE-PGRS family protein [Streptomyces sp. NPDC001339]|uniref:PE-PGRS family protein n=1 Tax=Streptomyces sp. NPDC001339 TaxID=3364563 RepID=UPI0036C0C1DC